MCKCRASTASARLAAERTANSIPGPPAPKPVVAPVVAPKPVIAPVSQARPRVFLDQWGRPIARRTTVDLPTELRAFLSQPK